MQAVIDHITTAYGDDGRSVYDGAVVPPPSRPAGGAASIGLLEVPVSVAAITEDVVERLRQDATFVALVAEQLGLVGKPELRTVEQLLQNDEDYSVEFKSTARWDIRENKPSKAIEDAIVKTVAAFLNTEGGTLLIGIGPDGAVVGLGYDYERVQPKNGDGFVNWLTTHLINAMGHTPVTRTRARVTVHEGQEICRVDVAASPNPVWTKTSKENRVFFVRMNNSTRPLPLGEVESYSAQRWGSV